MHIPDPRPDKTEERILPLINVVFLLLIFFMIAGSLSITDPIEVSPPVGQRGELSQNDALIILLDANGKLAVDGQRLKRDALVEHLQEITSQESAVPIHLKADASAEANLVVEIMEMLRSAGVSKLKLLTLEAVEP